MIKTSAKYCFNVIVVENLEIPDNIKTVFEVIGFSKVIFLSDEIFHQILIFVIVCVEYNLPTSKHGLSLETCS